MPPPLWENLKLDALRLLLMPILRQNSSANGQIHAASWQHRYIVSWGKCPPPSLFLLNVVGTTAISYANEIWYVYNKCNIYLWQACTIEKATSPFFSSDRFQI